MKGVLCVSLVFIALLMPLLLSASSHRRPDFADTLSALSVLKGDHDITFYELYHQKRNSDRDEAIKYLEMFVSSVDTSNVNDILADLCVKVSDYYYDRFQFNDALSMRIRSYNINSSLSRQFAMAEDEYKLAELYYMIGEYDKSFRFVSSSMDYFEAKDDTLHLLECYNILGALYYIGGDHSASESYLNMYLRGAREYGDSVILARALNNIALSYLQDTAKSSCLISEALELSSASADTSQMCKIYLNMATSYLASEQPDKARPILEKVFPMLSRVDDLGQYYLTKGLISYKANNLDSALVFTVRALDYFRKGDFIFWQGRCVNIIQEIYYLKGDYKNAYHYLKQNYNSSMNMNLVLNSGDINLYKNLYRAQSDISLKFWREILTKKYYRKVLAFSVIVIITLISIIYVVNILRRKNINIKKKESDFANLQIQNEKNEQEIQSQKEILEVKKMQQYQIHRTKEDILSKLTQLSYQIKDREAKKTIAEITSDLSRLNDEGGWDEINHCVKGVNSTFYKNLLKAYPDLTVNERRLCGLLNMNLTSKEIADITHQSPQTINTARARLRHRLGITGEDYSIQEFLSRFN